MILKATLSTLFIILIAVICMTYYTNKEGFDDISNAYDTIKKELSDATSTATPSTATTSTATTSTAVTTPSDTSAVPKREEVIPEVKISGSGYDAMTLQQRAELLKDIQKVVRNEILANRNTTPITPESKKSETDSTAQGKEYNNSCYKDNEQRCPKNPDGSCPPVPDMSQYIKKDAIPCWGCALDY